MQVDRLQASNIKRNITIYCSWPSYYHPGCLWLSFECKSYRSANQRLTDTSKIGEFESLPEIHKKVIADLLSGATIPEVPPYESIHSGTRSASRRRVTLDSDNADDKLSVGTNKKKRES